MRSDRDFIKNWMPLIGVGLLIGYALPMRFVPLDVIMNLASRYQTSSLSYNLIVGVLGFGGFGLFVGSAVGIAQYIVLRKYLSTPSLWIVFTTFGYFLGFSVVGSLTLPSMKHLNQFTMSVFNLPSGVYTLAVYIVFVNAIGILPTLVGLLSFD